MRPRADRSARARSLSRKLAMQALYQWQLAGQSASELQRQFAAEEGYGDAEEEYFTGLVDGVTTSVAALDTRLQPLIDRPLVQLDPVERAVLWIGMFELLHRPDVPYRVVINESVELTKRFGATDGHKFVNAVLDRAARELRSAELAAANGGRA
jgi:transcription antitermination protein NusB